MLLPRRNILALLRVDGGGRVPYFRGETPLPLCPLRRGWQFLEAPRDLPLGTPAGGRDVVTNQ